MKWEIKAQGEENIADIYINDFIGDWIDDYFGFGVTSKAFIKDINDLPSAIQNIRLHINSPGGDVVAASHIANTLRDQQAHNKRRVEILIEGAAWSAATIITSAGNPTKIADNALMMVHDPWTITLGNSRELRQEADVLDKFRDTIVSAYRWKSQLSEDDLIELMAADTWMDADEAIENGFADEKIEGARASASIDPKFMAKLPKVPDKYRDRIQAWIKASSVEGESREKIVAEAVEGEKKRLADIQTACSQAGVADMTVEWVVAGHSVEHVRNLLRHAPAIRERCAAARFPDRAAAYIKAGITPEEVSEHLLKLKAAMDAPELNNKLGPEGTCPKPAVAINSKEIYSRRKNWAREQAEIKKNRK